MKMANDVETVQQMLEQQRVDSAVAATQQKLDRHEYPEPSEYIKGQIYTFPSADGVMRAKFLGMENGQPVFETSKPIPSNTLGP
jgi:hypothetical protein